MNVDALIERSRRPGAFVERRRFTLSRDKAIEKLREFSLRHPAQYVLELVQAAVFAGATYIAVESRPERVLVAWVGGRRLRASELTQLFDYLFADRGDPSQRHLVQLAIGMNAILQKKPKVLRLESGDGTFDHTIRLDVSGLGDARLGEPENSLAGTYVMAEHRHGGWKKWLGRRWTPEEGMVEERCHYTPVPILLNGRAPFGYRASRAISVHGLPDQLAFDEGDLRGVLAIPWLDGDGRGVRIVVGGVWVTTASMPQLGVVPGSAVPDKDKRPYKRAPFDERIELAGVVCDDRLRKTADQGDVVRDRRFQRMLDETRPHATRLLRTVAFDYQPERVEPERGARHDTISWLTTVGPSDGIAPAALVGLPAVFRIDPDAPASLVAAADPARLPCPVLRADDDAALALQEQHGIVANPLRSAEDVAFVREVLRRRESVHVVTRSETLDGVQLEVRVQLQRKGAPPTWLGASTVGPPASLVVGGVCSALVELPLPLPWISVTVVATEDVEGWVQAANRALLDALPELIEAAGPRAEPLAAAALAATTWVKLREGGGLEVLLADERLAPWRARGLAGGPPLDTLLELAGTPRSIAVGQDTLDALAPLEELVGWGHLRAPELRPVARVGRRADDWAALGPDEPLDGIEELIWARPAFEATLQLPDGLPELEPPGTLLGHAGQPAHTDEGLRVLLRTVARPRGPRASGLSGLHQLQLAAALGEAYITPVLRNHEGAPQSLARRRHPHFVARGGASARPTDLVVTADELACVRDLGQLRLDDPAGTWSGEGAWVLRLPVELPGVRGWIGLRAPYDPTASILVRRFSELRALPDLEPGHPCHGLLEHHGLGDFPYELVRLAVLRAYQRLRLAIDEIPIEHREAARQYRDGARVSELEQPASALEQVAARVERAFAAVAEPLAILLTVDDGSRAVRTLAEADPSTWRYQLGRAHELVRDALNGPGRARDLLVLDLAMRVGTALRAEKREVDIEQLQQLILLESLRQRARTSA